MNPINQTQISIFLATFLAVSVIGNLFLYAGNADKGLAIQQQAENIETLNRQLAQDQMNTKNNAVKIESVDSQQKELRQIASELQSRLVSITEDYEASLVTAEQTENQLKLVEEQRQKLEQKVTEQRQQLSDAQKVIANQQRFIRGQTSVSIDSEGDLKVQRALSDLSNRLTDRYDEILLRQRADGAGIIEISLTTLFSGSSLELKKDAVLLLQEVSNTLKQLPGSEIDVIGHSDARPIVSDLSQLYPTNWELSAVRASKIAQALINEGVSDENMSVIGKAANAPIREEANPEAWQINRRIEIVFD